MTQQECHYAPTRNSPVHDRYLNNPALLQCDNFLAILSSATPYNCLSRFSRLETTDLPYSNLNDDEPESNIIRWRPSVGETGCLYRSLDFFVETIVFQVPKESRALAYNVRVGSKEPLIVRMQLFGEGDVRFGSLYKLAEQINEELKTVVWITEMPAGTTDDLLMRAFGPFGNIKEATSKITTYNGRGLYAPQSVKGAVVFELSRAARTAREAMATSTTGYAVSPSLGSQAPFTVQVNSSGVFSLESASKRLGRYLSLPNLDERSLLHTLGFLQEDWAAERLWEAKSLKKGSDGKAYATGLRTVDAEQPVHMQCIRADFSVLGFLLRPASSSPCDYCQGRHAAGVTNAFGIITHHYGRIGERKKRLENIQNPGLQPEQLMTRLNVPVVMRKPDKGRATNPWKPLPFRDSHLLIADYLFSLTYFAVFRANSTWYMSGEALLVDADETQRRIEDPNYIKNFEDSLRKVAKGKSRERTVGEMMHYDLTTMLIGGRGDGKPMGIRYFTLRRLMDMGDPEDLSTEDCYELWREFFADKLKGELLLLGKQLDGEEDNNRYCTRTYGGISLLTLCILSCVCAASPRPIGSS